MPKFDRQLITLRTPVHPSPGQARQFRAWLSQLSHLQQAALVWPHLAPRWASFDAVVQAVAAGDLPLIPVTVRPVSRARLASLLAPAQGDLPDGAWPGVVGRVHAALQEAAHRRVHPAALPAATALPLDDAVHPVGDLLVHVTGQRHPVLADLHRLPLGLTDALVADGEHHAAQIGAAVRAAEAADLAGHPSALLELTRLAVDHGPLLGRPAPMSIPPRDHAQRARHATLHLTRDHAGREAWAIGWSFRVPADWLPAATLDDTVGVDPGIRHLLTWADAREAAGVPRSGLSTGDWVPPPELATPLGAALVRAVQFRRQAGALDAALLTLLGYRRVAIEDTRWAGFPRTGRAGALEAMHLSGLTELQAWLRILGGLTGTRVVRVAADHTSHRCADCASPGTCAGASFHCPACGQTADRDVNAARWIRRQALRL